MTKTTGAEDSGWPAEARELVARQAAEIALLREQLADDRFTHDLRDALIQCAAAGVIAAPASASHLLEMIVEGAAHVTGASAAALFLVDEEAEELVFEVALGPHASEARKHRVPLGHGIAGLVAVTGQPLAVSDARRDPRHAGDIAEQIGYQPDNILCVPLVDDEQVIGVLEVLDKVGSSGFNPADIELLGRFANQAAVVIEQTLTCDNMAELLCTALKALGSVPDERKQALQEGAREFVRHLEGDAMFHRALEMARQVQAIVSLGEAERKLCEAVLASFSDYAHHRPGAMPSLGDWG